MKRALLVIDVQDEYFTGLLPITHPHGHLDNVLRSMDAARDAGVPIVVVQHTGASFNGSGAAGSRRRPTG
jgi:nicotinamidase-related amidase